MLLRYVLVFLLLVPISTVYAQSTSSACTAEQLTPAISSLLEQLGDAQNSLAADIDNTISILTSMQADISTITSECSSLMYSGTSNQVLGPIDFPDGLYKATLTTTGFAIAQVQPISGSCETPLFGTLFILMDNQGSSGAETTLEASNCSAIIALSNISSPWTLEFENLSPADSSNSEIPAQNQSNHLAYNTNTNSFLYANSNTEFTFDGSAGDIVTIGAVKDSGNADLMLELYAPNGQLLFSDDDSNPSGFLNPMISNIPLRDTGEYTVVVTRWTYADNSTSASFTLTLSER